jgi:hypothetical protein
VESLSRSVCEKLSMYQDLDDGLEDAAVRQDAEAIVEWTLAQPALQESAPAP